MQQDGELILLANYSKHTATPSKLKKIGRGVFGLPMVDRRTFVRGKSRGVLGLDRCSSIGVLDRTCVRVGIPLGVSVGV